MGENGRRRLTSWKEIAAHMGRDVRTVLRWEKQRGLPVHRAPGTTGRVVFAYTDELDAWVHGANAEPGAELRDETNRATLPLAPARSWPLALALVGASVLGTLAGVAWMTTRSSVAAPREIESVSITPTTVKATDAGGAPLWTYVPERRFELPYSTFVLTDVDGDGHQDVVISAICKDEGSGGVGMLLALDHQGRKLWEYVPQDRFTIGTQTYGPTWGPNDLLAYRAGGRPLLAWVIHHHTWWPGVVGVFNARGERTSTFVNAGWIRELAATADGRYLLAGGISNSRHGAAFAILDGRQPSGASPEEPQSEYACRNCPPGMPLRYFVVDWTDVIETTELGGRRGQFTAMPDGSLELRAVQRQNAEYILELTPSFDIKSRHFSDGFWIAHAELERDGVLKHGRAACPFRNGPAIHEWVPERGWRDITP